MVVIKLVFYLRDIRNIAYSRYQIVQSLKAILMKKIFVAASLSAVLASSCVTLGKYEALESTNNKIKKEWNMTKQELSEMKEENAELQRQNQSLNTDITDLNTLRLSHESTIDSLRRALERKQHEFDTTVENYAQQLTGATRDLNKAQNLLSARTKELNDKEAAFKAKEAAFISRQSELQLQAAELEKRQAQLEADDRQSKAALAAKEKELNQVRNAVNSALVGFKDKGMNVETRDGKVYVSMESKLMFASASWTVSKEGQQAIKGLAKVLEDNPDLKIMVEGHTDNDAYKGSTAVKDNWDLSVMRATSIVKLLLQYGKTIDPARIEASGHGEFAPKVANDTPQGKAQNRRTEIILTPDLTKVLNAVK